MARDAVWKLLGDDTILYNDFGITRERVFPNYGIDGSPKTGYFIVLRWEETSMRSFRGVDVLTVWFHRSVHEGRDFVSLKRGLTRVREILTTATHVPGDDGYTLSQVRFTGEGRDLHDTGYDTLVRNAAFEVLSYPTP